MSISSGSRMEGGRNGFFSVLVLASLRKISSTLVGVSVLFCSVCFVETGSPCVNQADLELTETHLLASASWVVGLKHLPPLPSHTLFFLFKDSFLIF